MSARLDVLFVNPYSSAKLNYHTQNDAMMYMASYLRNNGVTAQIIDLNLATREDNFQKLHDHLRRHRPRIAAVSGRWWRQLYGTCDVGRQIKAFDPTIMTVSGGDSASMFAEDMCRHGYFDAVIRGKALLPLLQLARGETAANTVWRENGSIKSTPMTYFRADEALELRLSAVDEIFEDPDRELSPTPYIWLGEGCPYNCLYCAAARSVQTANLMQAENGAKIRYRSADLVLDDLDKLSKWRTAFLFDYQPDKSTVLKEIIKQVDERRYGLIYEPWSMRNVDHELIQMLGEKMRFTYYALDPQTYSEPLRERLAARKIAKPFITNSGLETVCEDVSRLGDIVLTTGTTSMPTEQDDDIVVSQGYRRQLMEQFSGMENTWLSPVVLDPGAPMGVANDKYGIVLGRRGFDQFLEFSRAAIVENPVSFYQQLFDTARAYAAGDDAMVDRFNYLCGFHYQEDPGLGVRHLAATLNIISPAVEPFRADEITESVVDGVPHYAIKGNGRQLPNFGHVASRIVEAGHREVSIDASECRFLSGLPDSLVNCKSPSWSYIIVSPQIRKLCAMISRGDVRATIKTPPLPADSFLHPSALHAAAR